MFISMDAHNATVLGGAGKSVRRGTSALVWRWAPWLVNGVLVDDTRFESRFLVLLRHRRVANLLVGQRPCALEAHGEAHGGEEESDSQVANSGSGGAILETRDNSGGGGDLDQGAPGAQALLSIIAAPLHTMHTGPTCSARDGACARGMCSARWQRWRSSCSGLFR